MPVLQLSLFRKKHCMLGCFSRFRIRGRGRRGGRFLAPLVLFLFFLLRSHEVVAPDDLGVLLCRPDGLGLLGRCSVFVSVVPKSSSLAGEALLAKNATAGDLILGVYERRATFEPLWGGSGGGQRVRAVGG